MFKPLSWSVLLTLLLTSAPTTTADDKADEQAKEVVTTFMNAFKSRDLPGLMEAVEVPWFHSGKRVIKERNDLRKEFQMLLDKRKDTARLSFEIKQVVAYKTVREKTNAEERKLLDEVLTDDDRVLLIQLDNQTEKLERIVLAVRVKDGKAKVVGIRN